MTGASTTVDALSDEPYDHDAPRFEDYAGRAHEYIRDSAAHHAVPLSHLSVEERRKRWQSGQRWGRTR